MHPIRVLYCSNTPGLPERVDEFRAIAREARRERGCVEFDYFRDVEHPENFAQLELWESQSAFDDHWRRGGSNRLLTTIRDLCAPYHNGVPSYPRRHGYNGAEFYRQQKFHMSDGFFLPLDPTERLESLRWPSRPDHRIIIQQCTDPAGDATFLAYSAESRAHKGCSEFAYYRSIEFPENNLHLELWSGPPAVYDEHYNLRTLQKLYGIGMAQPPWPFVERRYGASGSEHYEHTFFTLVDDVWEPEDPAQRMATVRWP